MCLTLCAYGAGATISNPGSIDHTHRPIVFRTPFLWIKCCPLLTTQCAIRLREKVVSSQASYPCHACPLWVTEGRSGWRGGWGWQSFSSRGGKTR